MYIYNVLFYYIIGRFWAPSHTHTHRSKTVHLTNECLNGCNCLFGGGLAARRPPARRIAAIAANPPSAGRPTLPPPRQASLPASFCPAAPPPPARPPANPVTWQCLVSKICPPNP